MSPKEPNSAQAANFNSKPFGALGKIISIALLIAGSILLAGCGGGGGGGGSFIGAGEASLSISPNRIDVGDRTLVEIELKDANEDGIIVIVAFPRGLSYVLNTAFLEVDDATIDIGPDINAEGQSDLRYLVFFVSRLELDENGDGKLTFQLEGESRISEREIAVDLDVDDALINNNVEFDPQNPQFQVEDSKKIDVID